MSQPTPPISVRKNPLQPPNLFYRGFSMKGTFMPGDRLAVEKAPLARIQKGDLIIFRRHRGNECEFIVHRVIGIHAAGLVTQGDNRLERDRDLVRREDLIGRVIHYDRRGRIRRARNGGTGQLRAALLHGRLHAIRLLKCFLRKPYTRLKQTGLAARLWQPDIEVVSFETPDGPLVKYLHNGRTVAVHWRRKERWLVKRPYDLLFRRQHRSER